MIERSKQIRKQHELMALKHKLMKLQARKQKQSEETVELVEGDAAATAVAGGKDAETNAEGDERNAESEALATNQDSSDSPNKSQKQAETPHNKQQYNEQKVSCLLSS